MIRVLELDGTPRERGLAHGETLREPIREMLEDWRRMIERATGEPLEQVARVFRGSTRFERTMERWTPGLLDEIEGMATGAGVASDALFMFNCPDETDWFLEHRGHGLALPEARGCSSAALRGEPGMPVIGQNMDIPGATDGYQVLLRIREDERETWLFSLAGLIGMIGLSNAPLGVVNNSLRQLAPRVDGLPVNPVVRGLLAQPDLESAARFIREAPHASGHNYLVADAEDARMFECSANQVAEVPGEPRLAHTNHPLHNSDLHPDPRLARDRSTSNTRVRYADLERSVLGAPGKLDAAGLRDAFSSHADPEDPVCRHVTDRKTNFTAGCVIYEMSRPPVLQIAAGPPCQTPFERFALPA